MAEQTVDQIARTLKNSSAASGRIAACRTAEEPLLPAAETNGSGILPPAFSRQTVEHCVNREWAFHLDDVMVRRTGWHYYYRDAKRMAQQTADWMGELLGWDPARKTGEIEHYLAITGKEMTAENAGVKTRPANSAGT
jgi:glycerol-3-phosphate dehydrogenase